jgi:hypothetical protein
MSCEADFLLNFGDDVFLSPKIENQGGAETATFWWNFEKRHIIAEKQITNRQAGRPCTIIWQTLLVQSPV